MPVRVAESSAASQVQSPTHLTPSLLEEEAWRVNVEYKDAIFEMGIISIMEALNAPLADTPPKMGNLVELWKS
ncbi:hypothetical protein PTKIN_Ptkin06aG0021200 [Pterospermum kingtungense]